MKKLWDSNRWFRCALGTLAAACLVWLVIWAFWGRAPRAPQPLYLLKDHAGHPALYTPDGGGPLAQYDEVYTRLLPEQDVLALQQGVAVYSEAELQQRLEDYGL